MKSMELKQFLSLGLDDVTTIVRDSGTKTCVFPFNGTRRWFLLEHGGDQHDDPAMAYVAETTQGYIRLYKMLFDHGIETVLAPVFGRDILARGKEYMSKIGESMGWLAEHPEFLSFYSEYDVRVHFYGDYRKEFKDSQYQSIVESFGAVTLLTSSNSKHKLHYGVFASDATDEIARISTLWFKTNQTVPTRQDILSIYYGEHIEKADLFIGFERPASFDFPMLDVGETSLYFTVAPSLYMTQNALRRILYDHIFQRPIPEPDYSTMDPVKLKTMRDYYLKERDQPLGVGVMINGLWYEKSRVDPEDILP